MGKSIFGGNLTRLTSGYKSRGELEIERRKEIQALENRPVPVEWQVERFEQGLGKAHEQYLSNLELQLKEQKQNPPKPPMAVGAPPLPPGSATNMNRLSDEVMGGLPTLIGNPLDNLRKS